LRKKSDTNVAQFECKKKSFVYRMMNDKKNEKCKKKKKILCVAEKKVFVLCG
jgi:hypothetical protein